MASTAAILFDLDGTLVDTIDLLVQSMEFAFEHFDGRKPTRDEWVYGIGTTLRTQLLPYTRSPDDLEALVARYRVYQLEHHDRMTTPYPGVTDVLTELKANGHPMALVTSKYFALAHKVIAHVNYTQFFDVVVGGDSIANPKPAPDPVYKALADLGATADRAIFVGDSPHDINSGNAAGVATAACLWGPFTREQLVPAAPTHWLHDIHDLKAVVRAL